jgi:alkylation response protein AidB-like acyl-CoA dehydrogenase
MRFGEMAIAIESGNSFIKNSARIFDEYLAEQNAEKLAKTLNYAAMTRTSIEQICQDIMLRVTRSIGSRGLMKNYHFERVIRDLTMYLRQAAPDATLVNLGKYVLENELQVKNLWTKENE